MRVVYDFLTGRIAGIVDATGTPLEIGYTVQIEGGLTSEIITDAYGNTSETVTNVNGSIVRTIQHIADENDPNNESLKKFLITVYEYNANGKRLGTARAFTVSNETLGDRGLNIYDYVPHDLFWVERNVYDNRGYIK